MWWFQVQSWQECQSIIFIFIFNDVIVIISDRCTHFPASPRAKAAAASPMAGPFLSWKSCQSCIIQLQEIDETDETIKGTSFWQRLKIPQQPPPQAITALVYQMNQGHLRKDLNFSNDRYEHNPQENTSLEASRLSDWRHSQRAVS